MYKIAVIGPESTGKTALCRHLAEYYNAVWIPEYAREYVEKINRPYNYQDIEHIAKTQIEQELHFDSQTNDVDFVFFDTDLIITKVWFEHCYRQAPAFIDERLSKGFFDLYLLCLPDLEWEPDSVREHGGEERIFFFDWYEREIKKINKPYIYIQGRGKNRLNKAINGIEKFIKNNIG